MTLAQVWFTELSEVVQTEKLRGSMQFDSKQVIGD